MFRFDPRTSPEALSRRFAPPAPFAFAFPARTEAPLDQRAVRNSSSVRSLSLTRPSPPVESSGGERAGPRTSFAHLLPPLVIVVIVV
jgi:hypothetical protein